MADGTVTKPTEAIGTEIDNLHEVASLIEAISALEEKNASVGTPSWRLAEMAVLKLHEAIRSLDRLRTELVKAREVQHG